MKKHYIIGGLAVLGAVALIAWYKSPKKNSDGFFNANGTVLKNQEQSWCARKNSDGSVSYQANIEGGGCKKGWKAVRSFGDRENL